MTHACGPATDYVMSRAAEGSILGPNFWTLSYDSLLRIEMPQETCFVSRRNIGIAKLLLGNKTRINA